ncbi:hypothetical protein OHC33_002356 [Knufia fluminis]|uniref:Tail specific protease domain-containing protein n=1 Tax=Knufia fluminis TaxID=191047 RepID=A0AAN8I6J0_9EURO|nr:hypothetical protein OHC33_002356 [Knufia fluminis]
MRLLSTLVAIAPASLVVAQTRTATSSLEVTGTARQTISSLLTATAVPTGEACAAVSSVLAEQTEAPLIVAASLANECARSAPIDKADALRLIDGIVAALEFQSDVGHLASPPAEYPLAGVDLFAEISQLREQVGSDDITSEIDFESNFTAILGKAQNGHLAFQFDGLSVFGYQRLVGSLISVSEDGTSEPSIYVYEDFAAFQAGESSEAPSAVTQVNGQDVAEFLTMQGQNVSYGGFQDPDALYNQMFYVLNDGSGGSSSTGLFGFDRNYVGAETTISFADGSSRTEQNVAIYNSPFDFSGLEDGRSFYNLYCNATLKAAAQGYDLDDPDTLDGTRVDPVKKQQMLHQKRVQKRQERRQVTETRSLSPTATESAPVAPEGTQILGYPTPVAISDDLSISGYFLEAEGFEDTAVLVLQQMSEADPDGFQSTMTEFMNQCRQEGKTHLVLDVQGNPGGTISLGYEVFKQLFPDIFPYGAGTLRAQEGLDILGNYYTNYTAQLAEVYPDNVTLLQANNYYAQYSAHSYANSSGELFNSWDQLYGPVDTPKDDFTNLIRWNINDTDFNLASGSIVISGFGNNTEIQPSPFSSENIILLSDGRCSSTCTILAHFLKWQGKVKSVAMGGRPQTGAMQAVGGVKGSQVYQYALLASDVYYAWQGSALLGQTEIATSIEESSTLGPLLNDSTYIIFRGASAGVGIEALTDFTFNWQNNVAEGDSDYTPLQFVYEAADCRLWYQPQHINDVSTLWATVAAQAFGLNDTDVFSLCVEGSTNAPSSLSGNEALFNDGNPTNVTDFEPEQRSESGGNGGGGGSGGSGDDDNAAGRFAASSVAMMVAIAAALFAL